MDLLAGIVNSLTPTNLLYCFVGCLLGTLVGVLPGLGPAATLSILLPVTMNLNPTGSVIMLAGLAYGSQYGGSTTSILVNIPGEAASVVTCLDGYAMTKQGKAGQALWVAAVGSFIAGTLSTLGLSFIGYPIAKFGLRFGPPEYFGLLLMGMTLIVGLSGGSLIKGIAAGLFGMLLAGVGLDPVTAAKRFTLGTTRLMQGFDLVAVTIGLFGISEILISSEAAVERIYKGKIGKMIPPMREVVKALKSTLRATGVGFPLGLIPGLSPIISSLMAYDLEKKFSKYPEKFGTGVIEGVAAPEAANNATAQSGFVPLMCLGIPTNPVNAIILAALMLYGLKPGPVFFAENKDFVWTVIGSMYIGNCMLLILNLPLIGVWARVSTVPYKYLAPIILAICVVGSYSSRNSLFDVWVALGSGVLGYYMRKNGWPTTPLLVGLILGDMIESSLRQSITMGGIWIFFKRPIAVFFLVLAGVLVTLSLKFAVGKPEQRGEAEPIG
ncbi:MAG: tripartite tricarboxylate transporter permease [Candidatus Methanosuratincola sp.]